MRRGSAGTARRAGHRRSPVWFHVGRSSATVCLPARHRRCHTPQSFRPSQVYELFKQHPELLVKEEEGLSKGASQRWRGAAAGRVGWPEAGGGGAQVGRSPRHLPRRCSASAVTSPSLRFWVQRSTASWCGAACTSSWTPATRPSPSSPKTRWGGVGGLVGSGWQWNQCTERGSAPPPWLPAPGAYREHPARSMYCADVAHALMWRAPLPAGPSRQAKYFYLSELLALVDLSLVRSRVGWREGRQRVVRPGVAGRTRQQAATSLRRATPLALPQPYACRPSSWGCSTACGAAPWSTWAPSATAAPTLTILTAFACRVRGRARCHPQSDGRSHDLPTTSSAARQPAPPPASPPACCPTRSPARLAWSGNVPPSCPACCPLQAASL